MLYDRAILDPGRGISAGARKPRQMVQREFQVSAGTLQMVNLFPDTTGGETVDWTVGSVDSQLSEVVGVPGGVQDFADIAPLLGWFCVAAEDVEVDSLGLYVFEERVMADVDGDFDFTVNPGDPLYARPGRRYLTGAAGGGVLSGSKVIARALVTTPTFVDVSATPRLQIPVYMAGYGGFGNTL
ncbi:MAG: hypothetical protein B7733_06380 [Myxococcales bacterium FL481]|nr:MAG: hypothetical protein B7733_06380 [Myxococcales bacterium FL481]